MNSEVFSLRLPNAELDSMRTEAAQRGITVSYLIRTALRRSVVPVAWASFSAGCQNASLTVHTDLPPYCGGMATPAKFTCEMRCSS